MAVVGCTLQQQEAPPLAGPSDFATALSITVTPDILQQDGRSQSVVTVTARGPNGQPLSNVPLRAEIQVNGSPVDFGALSARSLVTDSNGRATVVYTAPPGVSGLAVDEFTIVNIVITPLGHDYSNASPRMAALRLVPTGTIVVPANLQPSFTISPTTAGEGQAILFDGSASTAPSNNPIDEFFWDFGDGSTATGVTVTHAYSRAGTYPVTLTIFDALGRGASTTKTVTITASAAPVANFVSSPAAPARGTPVTFNGASSVAATGRRIVSYSWDFGDPNDRTPGTGVAPSHIYSAPGTYTVTLTVTDDLGRTGTRSASVTVS
jgi:chitodextrinase